MRLGVTKIDARWLRFAAAAALVILVAGFGLPAAFPAPPPTSTIAFVQENYSVPQTSQTSVTVTYATAQTAGNLNIVAIGWNDGVTTISSVTDTAGNTYTKAIGATVVTGVESSAIYYAKNIVSAAANANAVTVKFSQGAPYPDVRILEYSGLDTSAPLDVTAAGTGSSTAAATTAVTTTAASELLFASNYVQTGTKSAGTGFTSRVIDRPDGDIAEDEIVSAAGSYSGTSTLSSSGAWVIQMATFRAAGSGPAPISVAVAPTTATVTVSTTQAFTATVSNDSANKGVTWTLAGSSCTGTACGTLTNATATTVTYTAPATVPTSPTVTVTATSVSDTTKSASATVTIAAVVTPPSGIAFVQQNYSVPQTSQTSIATAFTKAQTAGDLNIVAVSWNNTTSSISSITDTAGNTYTRAIGNTTLASIGSQAIYYAKNIAASSANSITVTFSAAAPYPDVRILEYAGLDPTSPLDVTAGNTGTSAASSSGAVTTTAADELLFAANYVATSTTSAGAGFTSRAITKPDGDIAEDEIVSSAASYTATANLSSTGGWIMQIATFRASGSGPAPISVAVSPTAPTVLINSTQSFTATVSNDSANKGVTWTLSGSSCSGTACGALSGATATTVTYTAPASVPTTPTVTVTATSVSDTTKSASATVTISSTKASAIAFVQQNYAVPSTPQGLVQVTYNNAQTAGNLNIVAIGWYDGVTTISSVTDTSNNTYTLAVGPTIVDNEATQAIYYAKNIAGAAAGANTVAVRFSGNAPYPDIRVLEYSGLDTVGPYDISAAGTGSSTNSTAGPITTTVPNELIFAANDVATSTTAAGAGFTSRVITKPDGDIAEDQIVTSTGTYTAAATLSTTGNWVMQVVGLRAAGSGAPVVYISVAPTAVNIALGASMNFTATVQNSANTNVTWSLSGASCTGSACGTLTGSGPTITYNAPATAPSSSSITLKATSVADPTKSATAAITLIVPSAVGDWDGPYTWPVIAIHSNLLPNGNVLVWEDESVNPAAQVWNPSTNAFTQVPYAAEDLFCSGHAGMANGNIFVAGGHISNYNGINSATIFNPTANTWTAAPNMQYARWYPTVTTLPNGNELVMSGAINCEGCNANTPEEYNPTTNAWTELTNATLFWPLYPHSFVLGNGNILVTGTYELPVETEELNLSTQTWTVIDNNQFDGGSSIMYLPNKFMKAGTSANSNPPYVASAATTYVLDMTASSPHWTQTQSMAYPRTYLNLTSLPDGTVLATGGETSTDPFDLTKAVYAAELWNPSTQTWTTLSSMETPRVYHSTALLLPDGRVLVAGGGAYGSGSPDQDSAELFSPPYLFKGARPTITSAPATLTVGTNFTVTTPDAATIGSVSLIRLGDVTHAFNQNGRFIPLTFTAGSGSLTVTAPASTNVALPGYYMLFIVNTTGVPSVASIVKF